MHAFIIIISIYLFIYYFLATFFYFSCDVHDGLIYKLTNHGYVTMAKCSDVMILATSYFTRNVFGKYLPCVKIALPGKQNKISIFYFFFQFLFIQTL